MRDKKWAAQSVLGSRVQVLLGVRFLLNFFFSNTILASMPEWSIYGKTQMLSTSFTTRKLDYWDTASIHMHAVKLFTWHYFIMETSTNSIIFSRNDSFTIKTDTSVNSIDVYLVLIIHSSVACVGIVSNLTVIVVFLNHKKFRRKIPNIFIINQVRRIRKLYTSQIWTSNDSNGCRISFSDN